MESMRPGPLVNVEPRHEPIHLCGSGALQSTSLVYTRVLQSSANQLGRAVPRLPVAKFETTRVPLAEYSFRKSYLGVYPLALVIRRDVSDFGHCNLDKPDRHCCSKPVLSQSYLRRLRIIHILEHARTNAMPG